MTLAVAYLIGFALGVLVTALVVGITHAVCDFERETRE